MNAPLQEHERLLAAATSLGSAPEAKAESPAGASRRSAEELAALRESWQGLAGLLSAAEQEVDEAALLAGVRRRLAAEPGPASLRAMRRTSRTLWLAVLTAAAVAVVCLSLARFWWGRMGTAEPQGPLVQQPTVPAPTMPTPTLPAPAPAPVPAPVPDPAPGLVPEERPQENVELPALAAWEDDLDEELATAQERLQSVEAGWRGFDRTLTSFRSRIQETAEAWDENSL